MKKTEENNKKHSIDELIEKGKKEGLSSVDLDEAIEEMDFDLDTLDKLYDSLEENDIPLNDDLSHQSRASFKYRATASCQAGSGVNPASFSFFFSRRLFAGRAALDSPYSAVLTGITSVSSPYCR